MQGLETSWNTWGVVVEKESMSMDFLQKLIQKQRSATELGAPGEFQSVLDPSRIFPFFKDFTLFTFISSHQSVWSLEHSWTSRMGICTREWHPEIFDDVPQGCYETDILVSNQTLESNSNQTARAFRQHLRFLIGSRHLSLTLLRKSIWNLHWTVHCISFMSRKATEMRWSVGLIL